MGLNEKDEFSNFCKKKKVNKASLQTTCIYYSKEKQTK